MSQSPQNDPRSDEDEKWQRMEAERRERLWREEEQAEQMLRELKLSGKLQEALERACAFHSMTDDGRTLIPSNDPRWAAWADDFAAAGALLVQHGLDRRLTEPDPTAWDAERYAWRLLVLACRGDRARLTETLQEVCERKVLTAGPLSAWIARLVAMHEEQWRRDAGNGPVAVQGEGGQPKITVDGAAHLQGSVMPLSRTAVPSIVAKIGTLIQAIEARLAAGNPLDTSDHPNRYSELAMSIRAAAQAVLRVLLPSEVRRIGDEFADVVVKTMTVDPFPGISAAQSDLRQRAGLKRLARFCSDELPEKGMHEPEDAICQLETMLATINESGTTPAHLNPTAQTAHLKKGSMPTPAATQQGEGGLPADPVPQYVTLDQMAASVQRSKRTLEKLAGRHKNPLPDPDIQGGGGKPNEWQWDRIRPWLEAEYGRPLPAVFPARAR